VGVAAGAALEAVHWAAPGLRLPPAGLVVVCMYAVTAVVAYYAPHTSRPVGKPSIAGVLGDNVLAGLAALGNAARNPQLEVNEYGLPTGNYVGEGRPKPPAVQAGGTGTGPAKEDTP
jgi:hypothetical protein